MMTKLTEHALATDLKDILRRAVEGEEIVVIRAAGGEVRLSQNLASSQPRDPAKIAEAIERLRRFREGHPLDGLNIREMIDEGRRY